MNDKKYYWLKLEENYFDLKVQKALRKLPSGSDMLICYLKMQLKYMNKGGVIEFQGIYDDITQEIALDIDEEEDLVKMTLTLLQKWRIVEPVDEGFYITEMQGRIGSKSDVALRVAKHREKQKMLHCNSDVTKCNSIKEIEIEKDKEIEKEIKESVFEFLESNFGRPLTPLEFEKIKAWQEDFSDDDIKEAIELSVMNNKRSFNYINAILTNWKTNGEKTYRASKNDANGTLPEWFGKDIQPQEISKEEEQELKNIIENF